MSNQQADKLQIKPYDDKAVAVNKDTGSSDPRVTAFLERLRLKANELETAQQENHVPVKQPRRRPAAQQPTSMDWYQPAPEAKAGQSAPKRPDNKKTYPTRKAKTA